jgi:hypothetical protein
MRCSVQLHDDPAVGREDAIDMIIQVLNKQLRAKIGEKRYHARGDPLENRLSGTSPRPFGNMACAGTASRAN